MDYCYQNATLRTQQTETLDVLLTVLLQEFETVLFMDGFMDLLNLHRFPYDGISQKDCREKQLINQSMKQGISLTHAIAFHY